MKILFTSLSGQDQTQSQHYLTILKENGHEVFSYSYPAIDYNIEKGFFPNLGFYGGITIESLIQIAGFVPDLFLYIEPNGLIPIGMEKCNFKTACILCDTHMDLKSRINLSLFFDYIFLYHNNYIKYFTSHEKKYINWHPYACNLKIFKPIKINKEYDIGFIGQLHPWTERANIINDLSKKYIINPSKFYRQSEIPEIYSKSKIVLNIPISDDLNFRTFEAMSCGSMLLTKRINNGQEILFKENIHFVAYDDYEEMKEKIKYYLENEDERNFIAKNALAIITEKHNLEKRVDDLLKSIDYDHKYSAPIRFMSDLNIDKQYSWYFQYNNLLDPSIKILKKRNFNHFFLKQVFKILYRKFRY